MMGQDGMEDYSQDEHAIQANDDECAFFRSLIVK